MTLGWDRGLRPAIEFENHLVARADDQQRRRPNRPSVGSIVVATGTGPDTAGSVGPVEAAERVRRWAVGRGQACVRLVARGAMAAPA